MAWAPSTRSSPTRSAVGATEGRAIGIHLTYSPVVDVQTRPENPVLSVRSFASDLDRLGRMASAYIRGYQDHGMLATAKHFPGRGDVVLIPGTEFTVNDKPAGEVEQTDFLAFQHAIDAGVSYVMSEHIAIPSVTGGSDLPASVEPSLATDWLRERLGFDGVLTTDDLWYDKVVDRFGAEQVGVRRSRRRDRRATSRGPLDARSGMEAARHRHDALLKPLDAVGMIETVVAAVEAGDIAVDRIDASVHRLLYWKARLNLHRNRFVDPDTIDSTVGTEAHRDLVRQVAERSLTIVRNHEFFPTDADALGDLVHVSIQKAEHHAAARAVAATLSEALPIRETFALGPRVDPARYDDALAAARAADTVVVSLFNQRTVYRDNGPLGSREAELLHAVIAAKPRATVVMSYGNPYLVGAAEGAAAFVVGYGEGGFYGNQAVYADAFVRWITGEIEAVGTLPVDLPTP